MCDELLAVGGWTTILHGSKAYDDSNENIQLLTYINNEAMASGVANSDIYYDEYSFPFFSRLSNLISYLQVSRDKSVQWKTYLSRLVTVTLEAI